jgi:hypothetical protein
MPKSDLKKISVLLDTETSSAVDQWAHEEDRPVGNLLRRIIGQSVEQRRQTHQQSAAA